jgi:TctA family transporter
MDFMLAAMAEALAQLLTIERMGFLALGAVLGLFIGIIPGIGGVTGLALLLPFTFGMDPYAAFALLLGLGAVTSTGDSIPAILFGVPGATSAQATCLDGHQMARNGEAGRALAAAYTAAIVGGIFGAVVLALTIPLLRPIMLSIGAPELLAFSIFGISAVSVLSGNAPLKGVGLAAIGVMLAMVGSDPQGGELRWTLDTLYLYDGLPLLPLTLGIFAIPELVELAIKRSAMAQTVKYDVRTGMWRGVTDVFRHWWLVLRCSVIGVIVGALPGMGSAVVNWLAYGHAARTEKDARKTFGKGDIRGLLAPESAANSQEGGSLVPTIAFGVPGSASMALLLGAFVIHGLQPGPQMVTENLGLTYTMVWSIVLANIIAGSLCFMASGQLAKVATLRWTLILPVVMSIIMVGAYQATGSWGDLITLLLFGLIGWGMKRGGWPRPPLILGFVLGDLIERYMFISNMRYGASWLLDPLVIVLLGLAVLGLARPLVEEVLRKRRSGAPVRGLQPLTLRVTDLPHIALLAVTGWALWEATTFRDWESAIAPYIVGSVAMTLLGISFLNQVLRRPEDAPAADPGDGPVQMELAADDSVDRGKALGRGAAFFGWLIGIMVSMALIGLILTIPLFILAFMWTENRERLTLRLGMAAGVTGFVWLVFDYLLGVRWPDTVVGTLIPWLGANIPSM